MHEECNAGVSSLANIQLCRCKVNANDAIELHIYKLFVFILTELSCYLLRLRKTFTVPFQR